MNGKTYYIPIYQIINDDAKCVLAYFNGMTAHTDYTTLGLFFDLIKNQLEAEEFFREYACDSSNLKILYQHPSNGEYYLWDKKTKPTFEKHLLKKDIENTIKKGFIFCIENIELSSQNPHILWEEIKK